MRLLIVAATGAEVAPVIAKLGAQHAARASLPQFTYRRHEIDLLTTGVGMVATAAHVSRALTLTKYDLAMNIGVCGSFDAALPPGTAVHVVSECLPELGAEDGENFLTAQELGLVGADDFPFTGGQLIGVSPPPNTALDRLPRVRGISVSTVHGHEPTISSIVRRLHPQVESMEGAAFVYASLIHQVPSAQVRVVSNAVERRRRESWKLAEAIATLGTTAMDVLDHL